MKFRGLSAYLLTTVEVASDGDRALTADEADAIAQDILDRMTSAQSLTSSAINTLIQAETADGADADGIGKGNSTTTVLEILQILSGTHTFTVPDAQVVEVAGEFQALAQKTQLSFFSLLLRLILLFLAVMIASSFLLVVVKSLLHRLRLTKQEMQPLSSLRTTTMVHSFNKK